MSEQPESMSLDQLIGEIRRLRTAREREDAELAELLAYHRELEGYVGRLEGAQPAMPEVNPSAAPTKDARAAVDVGRTLIERAREAEERSRQLHQLALQLTQAENRERRRLAFALHDGLQQLLIAARMKVGALEHQLRNDPIHATALRGLELIDEAIAASRSLSVELSPPMLYEAGLAATLDWLSRHMEEQHGLHVDVHSNGEPEDHDVSAFLFQCIRELLLNIVKHADVPTARIIMHKSDTDGIRIAVCDEGRGFDLDALQEQLTSSESFGLRSIHERIKLLGGRCEIETAPGAGTRVVLTAPLNKAAASNVPT